MAPSGNRTASPTTDAPQGMPHADEGLRALIERFRGAPDAPEFVELTAALLARGHAAEALRVAEHGLQHNPGSADGRAERAAALLALGRPRVAYVELRRALAIEGQHRRALRLLGRAYKDAGVPSRAAELLAKRFATSDTAPSSVAFPPAAAATEPDAPVPAEPTTLPPNLFSNLTVDLGLGSAVPEESPPRRVEITQIIRRKGMPRPPRSASELVAIEGPIVDTTQPGQIVETERPADPPPLDPPALAPLFDLADEPLFQDATPFEVRPVQTQDLNGGRAHAESDTVVEAVESTGYAAPPPVDLVGDLGDLAPDEAAGPLVGPPPAPPRPSPAAAEAPRPAAPTPFEDAPWTPRPAGADEVGTDPFGQLQTRVDVDEPGPAPAPLEPEAARPTVPLAAAPASGGLGLAAVERARVVEGRIVVVRASASPRRVLLAVLGAAAMLLYAAALVLFSLDALRPWWSEGTPPAAASGSSAEPAPSAARTAEP